MFTKVKPFWLLSILLILIIGSSGNAESLYDPKGASLFTDLKAQAIGDIVFILIEERTTTSSEAETDASKEIDIQGGLKVTGFFEDLLGFPNEIEPILESIKLAPDSADPAAWLFL